MIYITGHQKPDTDSVASAIAYAYLKNQTGQKALPVCLGKLSRETRFVLDKFGFDAPALLSDARNMLAEINLDDARTISEEATLFEAHQAMEKEGRFSLAVVNEEEKMTGIVTGSTLSAIGLHDTAAGIELLKHTSLENIVKTLDGTLLTPEIESSQMHLNGKVSMVAMTSSGVDNYDVKDRIVIVGDDAPAQKKLIEKGAGMLILVWSNGVDMDVLEAAARNHCPILLSGHGTMNTSRYLYFAPPVKLVMQKEVKAFYSDEFVEDVEEKAKSSRIRAFPVISRDGYVLGFLERYHLLQAKKKQLILVDHNEFSQSVPEIEKAEVVEVVDHHRISDFSTMRPIQFRAEIVGSTATIITKMYREKQVQIPKNIAGLLLSAILSDTLKFASPTTCQEDIFTAQALALIAGLNIDAYAREMFMVSTDLSGMEMADALRTDFKEFEINGSTCFISQVFVYSYDDIQERQEEILQAVAEIAQASPKASVAAVFTSIHENGSRFVMAGEKKEQLETAFAPDTFYPGILSRKNQILPAVSQALMRKF